ncbi:alpha/beta hydrolase [Ostreiculturibacter nitratireducens]|uniref:alpha/beta fold hydrolase n=1 Tax=Ostreiculturibacter nitratireducens TaxID=3075226 RepID=UPI0031B598FA
MPLKSLLFQVPRPKDDEEFVRQRAPIKGRPESNGFRFIERIVGNHAFLEQGEGKPVIFCSGLAGSIENIFEIGQALSENYRFICLYLPLYDMPLADCTVPKLADYIESFLVDLDIDEAVLIGSSMGAGAMLHYGLSPEHRMKGMVLCGSAGLSSIPLQKGYIRRRDYNFLKSTVQDVFYDPNTPSEPMIQEVYDAIQRNDIALRFIRFTKSTTSKHHLHDKLQDIDVPCLLLWGEHDQITPVEVAPEFERRIPDSELHILAECGHVPTQEKPEVSLRLIREFMERIGYR